MVTHDAEEAKTLCGWIGLLESGRLVHTGSYRDLDEGGYLDGFASPGHCSFVLRLSPSDFERIAEEFRRAWKGCTLKVKNREPVDESPREERVALEISEGTGGIAVANRLLQWFLDRNVAIRSFHDAAEDE